MVVEANWYFPSNRDSVGEESSPDEQCACAMLATQLYQFLGGAAVQYRQEQGDETDEFMQLFPNGVSYKVKTPIRFTTPVPPPYPSSLSHTHVFTPTTVEEISHIIIDHL